MRHLHRATARALTLPVAAALTAVLLSPAGPASAEECSSVVQGSVADITTGAPLEGLRVELVQAPPTMSKFGEYTGDVLATTGTDADGWFGLEVGCVPGVAFVRAVDDSGTYTTRYAASGSAHPTSTSVSRAYAVFLGSGEDAYLPMDLTPAGEFHAVAPRRVLDTREDSDQAVPGGENYMFRLDGMGGGVVAVVLNLTATAGTAPTSFVSLHNSAMPYRTRDASLLNSTAGRDVANLVTVPVEYSEFDAESYTVALYNDQGYTHLVADLVGYYSTDAGAGFVPTDPSRVLDTRTSAAVGPAGTVTLPLAGLAPSGAVAVALTLTSTEATAPTSYVTAYPSGAAVRPSTSSLNAYRGDDVPNLAVVPLGPDGAVTLYNDQGSTHLVADVVGWFVEGTGASFHPIDPWRSFSGGPAARNVLHDADTRTFVEPSVPSPVPADAVALALNLTTAGPTVSSYLTAFPTGSARPYASSTNSRAGGDVATGALSRFGPGVSVYNDRGTVTVLPDLYGYFADPR